MVLDPEVGLGYNEPMAPEDESDDGDSDFEALDFEDEDDSDFSFPSVHKKPHKRTARVDTRHVEAVEQMQYAAAAEASIREFMSRGASTSAGSSSHNISGLTGFTVPMESYCDSDVVPDSEPEGDLLEPEWKTPAKGKGKIKSHWNVEYNADDIQDAYSMRKETRRRSNLEKQDMRMLEYQLGRRLTYVGPADISLIPFFPIFLLDSETGRKIYNSVAEASS